jgi:hypothetical protein
MQASYEIVMVRQLPFRRQGLVRGFVCACVSVYICMYIYIYICIIGSYRFVPSVLEPCSVFKDKGMN